MRYAMIVVLLLSTQTVAQQQTDTRFCQNVTMNADGSITIRESAYILGTEFTTSGATRIKPGMIRVRGIDLYEHIHKTCANP